MCESPIELFLLNLFLNWRIVALQYCAGFCHTTTHLVIIIHPSTLSFPPFPQPTPLGHHRARGWAPCVIKQLPVSSVLYTRRYMYVSATLNSPHPLLPHESVLSICPVGLPGTEAFLSPVSCRQESGCDDLPCVPKGRFVQLLIKWGAAPEPAEIKGTREGHQDWESRPPKTLGPPRWD